MARIARQTILQRFRGMIERNEPIVGGGAGTGLSAKCEEAGGIDLIVIYNSGRYRMAGRGSLAGLLAYGNANAIVMEMAHEVLPMVKKTPVLAGVNGTDPFMITEQFLREVADIGFSGVQNFPDRRSDRRCVSQESGRDRDGLRRRGRDDPASARAGSPHDALRFLRRGCARDGAGGRRHRGLPHGAHDGRRDRSGDGADVGSLRPVDQRVGAKRPKRPSPMSSCCVMAGRSPRPQDATYILQHCRECHGFYGASSMERLPAETALTEQTRAFKQISR